MIAMIKGSVWQIKEDSIIVDTGNIGYQVFIPMASYQKLPKLGDEITLLTYLQTREDAQLLFGFEKEEQLITFELLLSVSGIGAKTAMAVLNDLSVPTIITAIRNGDYKSFTVVTGIGKKTAQRILLELKDKVDKHFSATVTEDIIDFLDEDSSSQNNSLSQVTAALMQLGYDNISSKKLATKAIAKSKEGANLEDIITEALRQAAKI